jgi:RNAse (barnase) inhibitor barstar
MKQIRIDGTAIKDWDSFYDVFAKAFGFPGYFGRNMNAWIDCMTNLDEDDMNDVRVNPGELVCIRLDHADEFKACCPEQFQAFVECSAFVNWRRMELGQPPILVVSCYA